MLQLYFTRAKIFLIPGDDDNGERRFTAQPSTGKPMPAPDWVRDTATYKFGIKDKSIVDLTPPKRASRKAEAEPEPDPVEAPVVEAAVEDDDDAAVATVAAGNARAVKAAREIGKSMGLKAGR